ncbi:hypothetical protein BHE74_00004609 [Ensete ventricosum]|nr:hypothetical protein BHE74_00004609 [Ensete ventricosum]
MPPHAITDILYCNPRPLSIGRKKHHTPPLSPASFRSPFPLNTPSYHIALRCFHFLSPNFLLLCFEFEGPRGRDGRVRGAAGDVRRRRRDGPPLSLKFMDTEQFQR